MKKVGYAICALVLAVGVSFAAPRPGKSAKGGKAFVGYISDSMCGLKHMMPGKSDKECTLACVKEGSKFVLADREHNKVYQLSDQPKTEQFAGAKVKVTGKLKGNTIQVTSIEAEE